MKQDEAQQSLVSVLLLASGFALSVVLLLNIYLSSPDSAAYYSVPRSILIDHDLDFQNEYLHFEFQPNMFYLTGHQRLSNDWPIGAGLLWLPFFIVAHLLALVFKLPGMLANGYSAIYQLVVSLGILLYAVCGLVLSFQFARKYVSARAALFAVALVVFGSPLGFYLYYYDFMSHVVSFFAISLFLYIWATTYRSRTLRQWGMLGLLAGVMTMVRPQNVCFLIVIVIEYVMVVRRELLSSSTALKDYVKGITLLGLGLVVGFLPQMLFWLALYGSPIAFPKMEEMHWFKPKLWSMLFSQYHGLLSWSPILVLVVPGLYFIYKKEKPVGIALGLALAIQVYLNSANEVWWAGGSFGNRRFADYAFIFVPAIALVVKRRRGPLVPILCLVLAAWNWLLVAAERAGMLTLDHFVPWAYEFWRSLGGLIVDPLHTFEAMIGDFGHVPIHIRVLIGIVFGSVVFLVIYYLQKQKGRDRLVNIGSGCLLVYIVVLSLSFVILIPNTRAVDAETFPYPLHRTNRVLWNNYYEYGYYLLMKRKYHESIEAYEKAVALWPEHPNPYRYLGTNYYRLGQYRLAAQYCREALALDPEYRSAAQWLAASYWAILAEEPHNLDLMLKLARLYREQGDLEHAQMVYQAVLEQDPNNKAAQAGVVQTRAARNHTSPKEGLE